MKSFYLTSILLCTCLISISQTRIDTFGFEQPDTIFFIDTTNASNLWQIGKPSKTNFTQAFEGENVIVTDTLAPYSVSSTSSFTLGFVLEGWGPSISFKHKINTDTLQDGGYIEASADSGKTWTLLTDTTNFNGLNRFFSQHYPYGLHTVNFYSILDSLSNKNVGFSGNSNGWQTARVEFPCFAIKKPFELYLRFTFVSDSINNPKDGWMIDEVVIDNSGACSSLPEADMARLNIYPNPVLHEARIELPEFQASFTGEVLVFSQAGAKVLGKSYKHANALALNTERLPKGVYQVLLKTQNGIVASARFIK